MIPRSVAMVRPAAFHFNAETAVSNAFQHEVSGFDARQLSDIARLEFDRMVHMLERNGIEVIVFEDRAEDNTPDSIFPNNWFSTFGPELLLYSMFTENRRRERKPEIYQALAQRLHKPVNDALLQLEAEGKILEGTGSLVCDHLNKVAYAALSPRTDEQALDLFEQLTGYRTVRFRALGPDGAAIYHTNVMMCIADDFTVIGLDTVMDEDRPKVLEALKAAGKAIIELDNSQVYEHFAGNMLQLQNAHGQKLLLMSAEALHSLNNAQLNRIAEFGNHILAPAIHMIERIGGGSVRCMMAELFYAEEGR